MKRLNDRYILERELGSGGMAAVFLGTDEVLDRPVAIKILKRGLGPEISSRFRREGRTAARLSHPNIVQVYDAGEGELDGREVSYIVMEYLPGGDLKDLIDERGPISAGELAKLGEEAAAGLAHAHARGVIHRDVKPHNILLDEGGHPKLTDFGIARALDATTSNPTRTGAYLGTALYSSPEQLQGEAVTPKSDVYSLGTTLYQAATGKPPFTGSPISVANQHVSKPPPSLREANEDVGGELETLILACLAKEPDERPSAEELRSQLSKLEEAAGDTPVYAPPVTPPSRSASAEDTRVIAGGVAHRRRRRLLRTVLAVLALLAALALVAAIVVPALWDSGQERQTAQQGNGGGQPAQRQSDQKPNNPSGGGDGNANARASPVTTSTPEPTTSTPETAPATSQATTEPSRPTGLTEEAAARTVVEVYDTAAAGDYGTSYSLLSQSFQQRVAPTQAVWSSQFDTLQSVRFIEGPTVRVSGNTATVTGTTIARHTDRTERNTGTWTLVNEGGQWKLDDLSVQTEEI